MLDARGNVRRRAVGVGAVGGMLGGAGYVLLRVAMVLGTATVTPFVDRDGPSAHELDSDRSGGFVLVDPEVRT